MKTAVSLVGAVLAAVATTVVAPPAQASGIIGNYELLSNRWNNNSWVWVLYYSCGPNCGLRVETQPGGALDIQAIPRPLESQPFEATATLADGQYTMIVDTPDGVRCPGRNLPSHDTYRWAAATFTGTVDVAFNQGCFGAPAGMNTYTFALRRM